METKQKKVKAVVSVLTLAGLLLFSPFAMAGSLEPSAPPGPTMKTLDEVEPRVPIHASDLPLTITEPNSYYLVEDIDFTDTLNHAIRVECNDVTIDLMGFSLTGPDAGGSCGIYMGWRTNVEIRNGTVRDFCIGIYEVSSSGKQHRVINVRVMSNALYGIALFGYGHFVKDCTAAQNGIYGIYTGSGCTVTGNTAYSNDGSGIYAGTGSTATGNTTYDNGSIGIYTGSGCTVTGNTVYYNSNYGISASSGCTVTGNTCYSNGDDGIYAGSGSTVTGNTCYSNGDDGIYAGSGSTQYLSQQCWLRHSDKHLLPA
ncbi:MAG: right-handed parallel beta-helix repeat-containing protein [Planctomycetota bacterium]